MGVPFAIISSTYVNLNAVVNNNTAQYGGGLVSTVLPSESLVNTNPTSYLDIDYHACKRLCCLVP
jgi:hypothetical protein